MQWYYDNKGKQQGPVSQEELRELRRRGEIKGTDLIWNESMENWLPYAKVLEISSISEEAESYKHKGMMAQLAAQPFDILCLMLGVLSIVFFCLWCLGIQFALISIPLGIIALKGKSNPKERGMTTVGLTCAVIGIILNLAVGILHIVIIFSDI